MTTRLLVTSALLLAAAGYLARATQAEVIPLKQPLHGLPLRLERWQGSELPPLPPAILKEVGVDEYVNRIYASATEPLISLYVGYYASQRQGDTMHSPLNCMPGAGWEPVHQARATFDVPTGASGSRSITVNNFVIQKGLDRQLVMYWYQSRDRVVASEYAGKVYTVYDAIRLNRTDGALVRVITPIVGEGAPAEEAASGRAREFVQRMFAPLSNVLPS